MSGDPSVRRIASAVRSAGTGNGMSGTGPEVSQDPPLPSQASSRGGSRQRKRHGLFGAGSSKGCAEDAYVGPSGSRAHSPTTRKTARKACAERSERKTQARALAWVRAVPPTRHCVNTHRDVQALKAAPRSALSALRAVSWLLIHAPRPWFQGSRARSAAAPRVERPSLCISFRGQR